MRSAQMANRHCAKYSIDDPMRCGDVIRLTNFPCNQNQARNDADYTDDLRDVAPVLVFHVSSVRFTTNAGIVAQEVWSAASVQKRLLEYCD